MTKKFTIKDQCKCPFRIHDSKQCMLPWFFEPSTSAFDCYQSFDMEGRAVLFIPKICPLLQEPVEFNVSRENVE